MKKVILLFACFCSAILTEAQTKAANGYRNFPIIVGIQFHSVSVPLNDLKTNFSNAGFFIGTEVSLNGKSNWAQQFFTGWQCNKATGSGPLLFTQTVWMPQIAGSFYTEIKAGIGAMYAMHSSTAFKFENGNWVRARNSGNWLPFVPVGVSVGYHNFSKQTIFSPFISYQLMAIAKYNPSAPVITGQWIQIGSRIHL